MKRAENKESGWGMPSDVFFFTNPPKITVKITIIKRGWRMAKRNQEQSVCTGFYTALYERYEKIAIVQKLREVDRNPFFKDRF